MVAGSTTHVCVAAALLSLMAGCTTTRYVPTNPQLATWQEAHQAVRSLVERIPGTSAVRLSDEGVAYTIQIRSFRRIGSRSRVRKVVRKLLFAEMVRVVVARHLRLGTVSWRVEVSLGGDAKHVFPASEDEQHAHDLAASVARVGDFAPDPTLEGPDLPPVVAQEKGPFPETEDLDEDLDLALREGTVRRSNDDLSRADLLLDQPIEEEEGYKIRLWVLPRVQYTVSDDVVISQQDNLELESKGLEESFASFGLDLRLDLTPHISVDAGFGYMKFDAGATSRSKSIVFSPFVPPVLDSDVDVQLLLVDAGVSYRWALGMIDLLVRVGARFALVRTEVLPTDTAFAIFGSGEARPRGAMPMVGASLRVRVAEHLPLWVELGADGGLTGKVASGRGRVEVSYTWTETFGAVLGYRADWVSIGEESKSSEAQDNLTGVFHGPFLAVVVTF